MISIRCPMWLPIFFPNSIPSMATRKVMEPKTKNARIRFTCVIAKLTPTASASMLVANAIPTITLGSSGLNVFTPSSLKLSMIILTPIMTKRASATQWSTGSMYFFMDIPPSQPKIGMAAWKNPSTAANRKASKNTICLRAIPLEMETARVSNERPKARRIRVNTDMNCFWRQS